MTRSDLLSLARIYVPEAPSGVISDANVYILLNNAAQEFVDQTNALPTYTDFDVASDTQRYALSSVVTTYSKMRKQGIWLYDNSNSKWKQLDSTTGADMNKRYPTWLNDSTSTPQRAWIDGDYLYIHPKGDDTDDDIRVYHYSISTDMSAATHYPFSGSTTRYSWLSSYEETLLEYYRWKAYQILGGTKVSRSEEAKQMFYGKCEIAKQKLAWRVDLIPFFKTRGAGFKRQFEEAYKK